MLIVNGNALVDDDKILPLLTEGENNIRLIPNTPVGPSPSFFSSSESWQLWRSFLGLPKTLKLSEISSFVDLINVNFIFS
jgi:hypothetical protein